jgi:hypothetical protein
MLLLIHPRKINVELFYVRDPNLGRLSEGLKFCTQMLGFVFKFTLKKSKFYNLHMSLLNLQYYWYTTFKHWKSNLKTKFIVLWCMDSGHLASRQCTSVYNVHVWLRATLRVLPLYFSVSHSGTLFQLCALIKTPWRVDLFFETMWRAKPLSGMKYSEGVLSCCNSVAIWYPIPFWRFL